MHASESDVFVIGAGVLGLSTALYLQRAGRRVTLIDPLPPGGGTSFGNAGMISADTATPVAMLGMLKSVPRWLTDPMGPLAVRPCYLPKAFPWLLKWITAGRTSRVLAISDSMRALHRNAFGDWQELLGSTAFDSLIRRQGQIQLWESAEESGSAIIERRIRERHRIEAHDLNPTDLRELLPGISPRVQRGLFVPGNGFTVNPARLVGTLADLFREAGGVVIAERVMKLVPKHNGFLILTNTANHHAATVIVAAGVWSSQLLRPLGIKLPLESERGYHAMLPNASIMPRYTISFKSRGFGITPMEGGLRCAGTVEFAGLEAAPEEQRAEVLVKHVKALFPDLRHDAPRLWMGHRPSTPDSLPILGPTVRHPGLFLAFGHGHFGITGAPGSAKLVSGMILEGRHARSERTAQEAKFGPDRFGGVV